MIGAPSPRLPFGEPEHPETGSLDADAIAAATSELTAPCQRMVSSSTPRMRDLALLA